MSVAEYQVICLCGISDYDLLRSFVRVKYQIMTFTLPVLCITEVTILVRSFGVQTFVCKAELQISFCADSLT